MPPLPLNSSFFHSDCEMFSDWFSYAMMPFIDGCREDAHGLGFPAGPYQWGQDIG